MAEQRDLNSSLGRQLDETRQREGEDAELSVRLQDAESELDRLQHELEERERAAQVSHLYSHDHISAKCQY